MGSNRVLILTQSGYVFYPSLLCIYSFRLSYVAQSLLFANLFIKNLQRIGPGSLFVNIFFYFQASSVE